MFGVEVLLLRDDSPDQCHEMIERQGRWVYHLHVVQVLLFEEADLHSLSDVLDSSTQGEPLPSQQAGHHWSSSLLLSSFSPYTDTEEESQDGQREAERERGEQGEREREERRGREEER